MAEAIMIYAEHTKMAGRECFDGYVDSKGVPRHDDGRQNDDVTVHLATRKEVDILRENAKHAGAGHDIYLERCATTIEDTYLSR